MWFIELFAVAVVAFWTLQLVTFLGLLAYTYAREWRPVVATSRAIAVRHKYARRRAARQRRVRQRQLARA